MQKTNLNKSHIKLGAKMVNFFEWEMPISYSSAIEEHNAVRNDIGIFDVSHMTIFDLDGGDQLAFLEYIFANDIKKISTSNKAIYGVLLNEYGGILDDLIIYHAENKFRLVSNCSTREQNKDWFEKYAKQFNVSVIERSDMVILAVQGPNALKKIHEIKGISFEVQNIEPFGCIFDDDNLFARTGYTGEDGFELIVKNSEIENFWMQAIELGFTPIGFGARDTLRLEAGLNLYGNDMTINNHPYESNLGWTIDMTDKNRQFIGKEALLSIDQKQTKKLVGVILRDKGVLRAGYEISHDQGSGKILSGSFSPTLQSSIGLARVHQGYAETGKVFIRNKELKIKFISPRLFRHDKID